jgi:hypothetical protein
MTDPAAEAARCAAVILVADLGPSLPAEVEAALVARNEQHRPERYLDLVSFAGLIVSIATLAWTIYNDHRNRAQENDQRNRAREEEPQADTIARQVRITLRDQDISLPPGTERITEIVATEIIRQSKQHQE